MLREGCVLHIYGVIGITNEEEKKEGSSFGDAQKPALKSSFKRRWMQWPNWNGMGDPCQHILSYGRQRNQTQPTLLTQSSFVCSDTGSVQRDIQTVAQTASRMRGPSYSTANSSYVTTQSSSFYGDTSAVPIAPQRRVQVEADRGRGRKRDNAKGVAFATKGHTVLLVFAVANGRNSRPTTDFCVYSNPATGTQVFNPGTSSEKVLHDGTKLKSVSPINIDNGYKSRGLKWQGKDAVITSQLQQMRANKRNQNDTSVATRSSAKGSSK